MYFYPAFGLGLAGGLGLVLLFGLVDHTFMVIGPLLLPLLVQDAVRMNAFASGRPSVAVLSDATWLITFLIGIAFVSTAAGIALVWALGGMCGAVVTRPWLETCWERRSIKRDVASSSLEYVASAGLGYLLPLLAIPLVAVEGVGAVEGAMVLQGPIFLLIQALIIHRMSGPAIAVSQCLREAVQLSATTLGVVLLSIPVLVGLQNWYGPIVLGPTWPSVQPLILPTVVTLLMCAIAFGPATVIRKMGQFKLSATVQISLCPFFVAFSLGGAAVIGPPGFLLGTACAWFLSAVVWWPILWRFAKRTAPTPA